MGCQVSEIPRLELSKYAPVSFTFKHLDTISADSLHKISHFGVSISKSYQYMGLNLFLPLRSYSSWASCIIVSLFSPLVFVWYTPPTQPHHLDTDGAARFQLQIVFVLFATPCGAYLLYTSITLLPNPDFLCSALVMGFVLALIHNSTKQWSSFIVHLAPNPPPSFFGDFLVALEQGVDEARGGNCGGQY